MPRSSAGRARLCLLVVWTFLLMAGLAPQAAQTAQAASVDQWASLDGKRLYYQDHPGGQPALVLVHGWSCNSSFWKRQAPALAGRHRLIIPDLIGHGRSDKPPMEYTQQLMGRGLKAVLDQAGVRGAVLVGHSMGISVCRQAIMLDPGLAKGLVSADGAVMIYPADPKARQEMDQLIKHIVEGVSGPEYRKFITGFMSTMHVPQTPPQVGKEVLQGVLATPQHVLASAMRNFMKPDHWKWPPLDLPFLALTCQSPDLPPNFEAELKKLFPRQEYQLWQGVGHFLMLEQPERFNQALARFAGGLK